MAFIKNVEAEPPPLATTLDYFVSFGVEADGEELGLVDDQPPCATFKNTTPMTEFIDSALCENRGVIAAFPRTFWSETRPNIDEPSKRIFALDVTRNIGSSALWLAIMQKTAPTLETMRRRIDENVCVYRSHGLHESFPTETLYDRSVENDPFELNSVAGIACTVTMETANSEELDDSVASTSIPLTTNKRIGLELETAAAGISPAIYASFLVFNNDYMYKNLDELPDNTHVRDENTLAKSDSSVVATISVTQTHGFTLCDMLNSHLVAVADPLVRPRVCLSKSKETIYEATASIARKIRTLANRRIIKLNILPESIVFVPQLIEAADGELASTGYSYYDENTNEEAVNGLPMMSDFNPLYCKAVSRSNTNYDADCAYLLMTTIMLASIKAKFGSIFEVAKYKLTGRSILGIILPEVELPERFSDMSISESCMRARRGNKLSNFATIIKPMCDSTDIMKQTSVDLALLVKHGIDASARDAQIGAVYHPLLCQMIGADQLDSDLHTSAEDNERHENLLLEKTIMAL